jgi:hypothetical protein
MPHVLGNAGGPPPPTRNETLLREAVDQLRAELDEYREALRCHHDYIDGLRGRPCGSGDCILCEPSDQATGGK